jgi:hypothetical protein
MSEILSHQPAAEAVGVVPKKEPLVDVSEVPVSVGAEESPDGEGILGIREEAALTEAIVDKGTVSQAEETKPESPKAAAVEGEEEHTSSGSTELPKEAEEAEESVEKAYLNGALKIEESVIEPVQIEKATPEVETEGPKEDIKVKKSTVPPVPDQVPTVAITLEESPKPVLDVPEVASSKPENEAKAKASAPVEVSTKGGEGKPVVEDSKKEVPVQIAAESEPIKREEVRVEEPIVVKTVSISTYRSRRMRTPNIQTDKAHSSSSCNKNNHDSCCARRRSRLNKFSYFSSRNISENYSIRNQER